MIPLNTTTTTILRTLIPFCINHAFLFYSIIYAPFLVHFPLLNTSIHCNNELLAQQLFYTPLINYPHCIKHHHYNSNTSSTTPPPQTTKPPCKTCVPYTRSRGQTYVPGYGGEDLIRQPFPNDNTPFDMSIMHTNDIHARMDEFTVTGLDCSLDDYANRSCFGGIARIKTAVDHIRATENNTYLFDAGDQFQGNMFYSYYKGNATAEFMNAIQYDVFSIGNHEFDDGPAHLSRFLGKIDAPAISANLDVSSDPNLKGLIAPYVVLTKYESRIGVVGFITKTLADISKLSPEIKSSDPVVPVQRAVDQLISLGVQRIICVSHNGYVDDMDLAQRTRGFSLIVGGHSHTLLHSESTVKSAMGKYPTRVYNLDGKPTYIVQAKMWGEYLGHLTISWDAKNQITHVNGSPIHLTMSIQQDAAFQQMVQRWRLPFKQYMHHILGTNPTDLMTTDCHVKHCGLGWFVADALRNSYQGSQGTTHPVIGIMNVGGLRASLHRGTISVSSIMTVFPFADPIIETTVTGTWMVQLLENVVAQQHFRNGRRVTTYLQFAGVRAVVHRSNPLFNKVSRIQIMHGPGIWLDLDLDRSYTVVMPLFVAQGGDNAVPEFRRGVPGSGDLVQILANHLMRVKVIRVPDDHWFDLL